MQRKIVWKINRKVCIHIDSYGFSRCIAAYHFIFFRMKKESRILYTAKCTNLTLLNARIILMKLCIA